MACSETSCTGSSAMTSPLLVPRSDAVAVGGTGSDSESTNGSRGPIAFDDTRGAGGVASGVPSSVAVRSAVHTSSPVW
jgi:hypothetical protein